MSFPSTSLTTLSRYLFAIAFLAISLLALWPWGKIFITTGWDKSNHFLAFFVLFLLMDFSWPSPSWLSLVKKVILLLAYGIAIEYIQRMVHRDFSLLDWLADAVGLLGYLLLRSRLQSLKLLMGKLPFVKVDPAGESE